MIYNIFSLYFGILLFFITIICLLFNRNKNLIMLIICLELGLLSFTIIYFSIGISIDDLIGPFMGLLILPLAGAESAISLGYLVCYYPLKGDINIY